MMYLSVDKLVDPACSELYEHGREKVVPREDGGCLSSPLHELAHLVPEGWKGVVAAEVAHLGPGAVFNHEVVIQGSTVPPDLCGHSLQQGVVRGHVVNIGQYVLTGPPRLNEILNEPGLYGAM